MNFQVAKDVQSEVGVHLHAGGGPVEGGQEEGQTGEEDLGHARTSLLGCLPTTSGLRQYNRSRYQESLQDSKHSITTDRQSKASIDKRNHQLKFANWDVNKD